MSLKPKNAGSGMQIHLSRPIDEVLKGKILPYSFQVGILEDGPHYRAKYGSKKGFAGGPARRLSRKADTTLVAVSKEVRDFLGFNYLTVPFKKKNSDIIKFTNEFFRMVFGEGKLSKKKRCENLLQAVVRNPILKGAYGRNSRAWARIKGFNRKLIDTAQFFKAIKARVRIQRVSK